MSSTAASSRIWLASACSARSRAIVFVIQMADRFDKQQIVLGEGVGRKHAHDQGPVHPIVHLERTGQSAGNSLAHEKAVLKAGLVGQVRYGDRLRGRSAHNPPATYPPRPASAATPVRSSCPRGPAPNRRRSSRPPSTNSPTPLTSASSDSASMAAASCMSSSMSVASTGAPADRHQRHSPAVLLGCGRVAL